MRHEPLISTRQAILREVAAATGATAAVLHERDELCRSYHQVAHVGGEASRSTTIGPLAFRHPLITWLRVNHHPLPVPDRIGVYDELAETDRAALGAAGVSAAIPLSAGRSLPGVVFVSGPLPVGPLAAPLPDWGSRLADAVTQAAIADRAHTAERTQRLAVAGQVTAGIAHEVRNPLAAIRSTVQLVYAGDVTGADVRPSLARVLGEVDRASDLLATVLEAGRNTAGAMRVVDLRRVVETSVEFLRGHSQLAGVRITIDRAAPALVASVAVHEVRQVLVNLLLNACQASRAGGVVAVQLHTSSPRGIPSACIAIRDEGTGIGAPDLARVFQPFFTTKAEGSGLGLAVCREIADRRGWQLRIDSQLGVGTTAIVEIPLHTHDADSAG